MGDSNEVRVVFQVKEPTQGCPFNFFIRHLQGIKSLEVRERGMGVNQPYTPS